MLRPATSSRRVLALALALSVGTGVGVGAATLWPASDGEAQAAPRLTASEAAAPSAGPSLPDPETTSDTAASDTAAAPTPADAPESPRVSRDEAIAIAAKVAPGRVVEVDEDLEATGLRYDVTLVQRRGLATQVEVDATTGRVLDTDVDDDWDGD
jgi:uncharacterized membrane protein YkoI